MPLQEPLILNVDDTNAARYARTRILTRAGLKVIEAASGTEALALARELRPTLILLDVKLPDIHGMEVCSRLKADPATSFILVLQTSASYIDVSDKIRALDGGADNYLFEPIEPAELLANVRALLRLAKVENELREIDRRKDEFLAVLAHELRNPLAPMRNAIAILDARSPAAPDWELRARATISRHLDHMVRLVDDLLDVSRLSHDKLALQMSHIDLGGVIAAAVESTRGQFERKQQQLSLTPIPIALTVHGDEVRLVQVLVNLLNNASKFTAIGGHIEVRPEIVADRVRLHIVDDGIGLAPERMHEIFGMFAQANALGHDRQDGLGIGLSLARSLVELHDGTISAYSAGLGSGSCFTVELPLVQGAIADGGADSQVEAAPIPAGGRRILVVDDNVDIADTMKELMELLGHQVTVAYSGTQALQLAAASPPQAVLLDIGLKDMTGYDLVRALRKIDVVRDAFMVACSGFSGDDDKQRAIHAGIDLYLVKPVSIDLLSSLDFDRSPA
ncbi:response regulator [Herbaspirillum sp. YR522]|uniref:ATP-binding response regulator n=1 Tax=Herbaspirillum sp. YR522 TaxID=1144342 RepID=UPI00026F5CFC|nr:response regulator [Herbaspirillum sp. YR522]EJM97523.1 signal transduction histidine kinase [Herbaspirillum sp. YR522]